VNFTQSLTLIISLLLLLLTVTFAAAVYILSTFSVLLKKDLAGSLLAIFTIINTFEI